MRRDALDEKGLGRHGRRPQEEKNKAGWLPAVPETNTLTSFLKRQ